LRFKPELPARGSDAGGPHLSADVPRRPPHAGLTRAGSCRGRSRPLKRACRLEGPADLVVEIASEGDPVFDIRGER